MRVTELSSASGEASPKPAEMCRVKSVAPSSLSSKSAPLPPLRPLLIRDEISPSDFAMDDAPYGEADMAVKVRYKVHDGDWWHWAEWRIPHFLKRLQDIGGGNVVSPGFNLWDSKDCKLLVCPPEDRDSSKDNTRSRKRKEETNRKAIEGNLKLNLKLKVAEGSYQLHYMFEVGSGPSVARRGPYSHNFGDSVITETRDLEINFMDRMEPDQSLYVGVLVRGSPDFKDYHALGPAVVPSVSGALSEPERVPPMTKEGEDRGSSSAATEGPDVQAESLSDEFRPPPGLGFPGPPEAPPPAPPGVEMDADGVTVKSTTHEGVEYYKAEWKILHLPMKLRASYGKALVSPPFNVGTLEDLRLMVCPDGGGATTDLRSRRNKETYNKRVSDGPLEAVLKLRASQCTHELTYIFTVGSGATLCTTEPYTHNFSDCNLTGLTDLGIDFIEKMNEDQSLMVGVMIKTSAEVSGAASAQDEA